MLLFKYLARHYIICFLAVFSALILLTLTFDLIEITRRASGRDDITVGHIFLLSFFKISYLLREILPFCVVMSALISFMLLAKRDEIVIARSAGVSPFKLAMPAAFVAFMIAIIDIAGIDYAMQEFRLTYDQLENQILTKEKINSDNKVWFKENLSTHQRIIEAEKWDHETASLDSVSFYIVDQHQQYKERYEALQATLYEGYWELSDVLHYDSDNRLKKMETHRLNSDLTRQILDHRNKKAESLSLFKLFALIKQFEDSELSANTHLIYFYGLMVRPFFFIALVLIAGAYTLTDTRRIGERMKSFLYIITIGLFAFVFEKIIFSAGAEGLISPLLASIFVSVFLFFLSFTLLIRNAEKIG
ncbi:MAG: LptF/LptG family permease [Pseudomonadota bacterium]